MIVSVEEKEVLCREFKKNALEELKKHSKEAWHDAFHSVGYE
jgi:hypothetical protein